MSDIAVWSGGGAARQELPPRSAAERAQETEERSARTLQAERDGLLESAEDSSQSLAEMISQARERAEEQRKVFQLKPSIRYGDAPLEAYARLARARTQADVSAASGYARRRMAQLKVALRQDEENSDRIRAAIAQLQKAVIRAGRKKKDLTREAAAERQREKALEEERRREAQRLRLELQRAKAQRAIREKGYGQEAVISDRLAAQSAMAKAQYQLPAQTAAPTGQTSAAMAAEGYAAVQSAAVPAAAGGSFTAQA